ncbi:helix-turn-helix transcriptional regulator [Flavisolibacter ginsenosidimutans]|nr:AraC family transcriptional regulator [Flavisolibacter ginsenosidimutans]
MKRLRAPRFIFASFMQHLVYTELLPEAQSLATNVLFETEHSVAGLVQQAVKRFAKPASWMGDEKAQLRYHYEPSNPAKNSLELRFCLIGNVYCKKFRNECNQCKAHLSKDCEARVESVDFVSLSFSPKLLEQFVRNRTADTLSEKLLSFQHPSSFTRTVTLCGKTRALIEGLLNHNHTKSLENIFLNAQTQLLLLNTLDCLDNKELDVINCKFLSNEADREKVLKAKEILVQQIGEPITIKQLSRKVAMNECYLKKGFKEMFGTTIFEFYQSQRMEHARYLLYEKGLSVTEVSMLLGYSSISHFSTAFKKHTGLKPCELLLR